MIINKVSISDLPRYNNGNPRSVKIMTEETPKLKKPQKPNGASVKPGQQLTKPDTKGRQKRGPLDWSLDELIAYRAYGGPPARIPDKEVLYKLGSMGVSLRNCADLFDISQEKFCSNLDWLENWQKGRSECASRVRAKIVEQALDENVLNAMIYLDKIMGGDSVVEQVQVNVRNETLKEVNTDDLLEIMYKQTDKDKE